MQHRISLWLVAGLFGVALVIGTLAGARATDGSAQEMRRALAYYDTVVARSRIASDRVESDQQVIALGYLERLRLGLGSPFRLVDQVRADPRLVDGARDQLGWAILGRLQRGEAYIVDSVVMDGVGPWRDSADFATGADHLELIRRTVEGASDARAGELAVRVAYELAATERTITAPGASVAAQVAALMRDRVDARRDLERLLQRAAAERMSLLDEVTLARQDRSLRTEQPPSEALDTELEVEAVREVPAVLASIRSLGAHRQRPNRDDGRTPVLHAAWGARLVELGAALPPQTPVAIATRVWRTAILHGNRSDPATTRFVASTNEETLAGAYSCLEAAGVMAREPALALLASAVQLRAFAQEEPWFPGMPAPTSPEIVASYGLRDLRFDSRVPPSWRPYFVRMVASSIADMQRVLPAFTLDGVSVRFGLDDLPDSALAMHDPATRTLRFSIYSSAGTLAHEFAHDLDWQSARRLYPHGGGYGTDRALREQRGPLASPVRGLAAARLGGGGASPKESSGRPAELFARDVDWFVASSLARLGRSNGYLSAVQDAVLTGYTPAAPRELVGGPGVALVDALAQMTFVPDETRGAFLDGWSEPAAIDPYLLVKWVAELRLPRRAASRAIAFREDAALAAIAHEPACNSSWTGAPRVAARRGLLDLALDARARGIVRRWAGWFEPDSRPAWANSVLGLAPYSPELAAGVTRRVRRSLEAQLESGSDSRAPFLATLATFGADGVSCGGAR